MIIENKTNLSEENCLLLVTKVIKKYGRIAKDNKSYPSALGFAIGDKEYDVLTSLNKKSDKFVILNSFTMSKEYMGATNKEKKVTITSKFRGHGIFNENNQWKFKETGKLVSENKNIKCKHCNKERTKEDHDGCLGTLPGLMNACCGHGIEDEAYIQFLDGNSVRGKDASVIIEILKKGAEK